MSSSVVLDGQPLSILKQNRERLEHERLREDAGPRGQAEGSAFVGHACDQNDLRALRER